MEIIVPCRSTISERFPIASFVVRVPRGRLYEVVCATDPRLFHTGYAGHRTPENFYTSRNDGLLPSRDGDDTFFIPPQQLRRFAGARRIFYALGTYGGRKEENPRFSISPAALNEVPSISVGADFTGRSLDRSRIGRAETTTVAYGSRGGVVLRWGGDAVLDAENAAKEAETEPDGTPRAAGAYDDGYDPSLWHSGAQGVDPTEGDDQDVQKDGPAAPLAFATEGPAGDHEEEPRSYDDAYSAAADQETAETGASDSYPYGNPHNGHGTNGHNGHSTNGHSTNGHSTNGPNGHGTNGHGNGHGKGRYGAPLAWSYGAESDGASDFKADRESDRQADLHADQLGYDASLTASDADAEQDRDDAETLGFEDAGDAGHQERSASENADADKESSLALADTTDDVAEDLGIDPDAAEDAADLRSQQRQGGAPPPPKGSAGTGDGGDPVAASQLYGHGPDAPEETEGNDDAGMSAAGFATGEKDATYREDEPPEQSLPVGPASTPLGAAPLDVAEKVRILRVIGRADSGADGYFAASADAEYHDPRHPAYRLTHLGLSWGLLMFNQRGGALGRVLRKAHERETSASPPPPDQRLSGLFGPDWQAVLNTADPDHTPDPEARVAPVAGQALWEEPWLGKFRAAGKIAHVQAAQNEVGVVDYFDRMMPVARWMGLNTARSLALLVDRAVHMGVGSGRSWVMNAIGPIRTEADRQAALSALGFAARDLRAFQARQRGLAVDGRWNAMTHAAMVAALRRLGDSSPIPLPGRDALVRALVEAARGTPFEARVKALADNRDELDDSNALELA